MRSFLKCSCGHIPGLPSQWAPAAAIATPPASRRPARFAVRQQKMWKKSQVEKALLSDFVQLLRALGGAPSNTVFLMAGRWGNNTSGLAGGEQVGAPVPWGP